MLSDELQSLSNADATHAEDTTLSHDDTGTHTQYIQHDGALAAWLHMIDVGNEHEHSDGACTNTLPCAHTSHELADAPLHDALHALDVDAVPDDIHDTTDAQSDSQNTHQLRAALNENERLQAEVTRLSQQRTTTTPSSAGVVSPAELDAALNEPEPWTRQRVTREFGAGAGLAGVSAAHSAGSPETSTNLPFHAATASAMSITGRLVVRAVSMRRTVMILSTHMAYSCLVMRA